jgi:hypothetical protein
VGNTPEQPTDRWFTTNDVARLLRIGPKWVRKMARERKLPGDKSYDGQWWFREFDFDAFIQSCSVTKKTGR